MVIVTLVAFIFLVPVVPFSTTVYTGLPGPRPSPLPCSNPNNRSGDQAVNDVLVYQGYESISRYVVGSGPDSVGVVIYSKCTIQ